MRYREGDKCLFVDSEVLARKGIAIAAKSIKQWDPPYDGELISPDKRSEIIANIKRALEFRNEPLEIM
jgi:hypothetical protein